MTIKLDNKDGRYDGLTHLDTVGVATVTERGSKVSVTFLKDIPADAATNQTSCRLVVEDDGQVRSFVAAISGSTMVVDDKHVPATFEALKGAAGKNIHFFILA